MTSQDIETIRMLARTECNLILTKWAAIAFIAVLAFLEARRLWPIIKASAGL
jgi:hypothetical protein